MLNVKSAQKKSSQSNKEKRCESLICKSISEISLLWKICCIANICVVETNTQICKFISSKKWKIYSQVLIILYLFYIVGIYGYRFFACTVGDNSENWYLTGFGYYLGDTEAFMVIILGYWHSDSVRNILEKLCVQKTYPLNIEKRFRNYLKILLGGIFTHFSVSLVIHIIKIVNIIEGNLFSSLLRCARLDSTYALLVRGLTIVCPTMHVTVTYILAYLIGTRFRILADDIQTHLDNTKGRKDMELSLNTIIIKDDEENDFMEKTENLHKELFEHIDEFNKCVGFQVILALSTSSYSMIYNLYQFSTTKHDNHHITIMKRMHYILSLGQRLARIFIYMALGQYLKKSSLKPLKTLQNYSVLTLSSKLQQQIQILLLQWSNKVGYLTAFGVVNFGPWLLAPIAGNIVTYLLVALQFNQNNHLNNSISYSNTTNA